MIWYGIVYYTRSTYAMMSCTAMRSALLTLYSSEYFKNDVFSTTSSFRLLAPEGSLRSGSKPRELFSFSLCVCCVVLRCVVLCWVVLCCVVLGG